MSKPLRWAGAAIVLGMVAFLAIRPAPVGAQARGTSEPRFLQVKGYFFNPDQITFVAIRGKSGWVHLVGGQSVALDQGQAEELGEQLRRMSRPSPGAVITPAQPAEPEVPALEPAPEAAIEPIPRGRRDIPVLEPAEPARPSPGGLVVPPVVSEPPVLLPKEDRSPFHVGEGSLKPPASSLPK
jgi:hypothetical protein